MKEAKEITRQWVERVVVGLNLCPFAHQPFSQGRIRYCLYEGSDIVTLSELLVREARWLLSQASSEVETTLLIHPNLLLDFLDYNDYLAEVEALMRDNGLEGRIQVASFHPEYQFAGTKKEDPENYTNRSPFPMLHLLREESIERALEHYERPEDIPARNIATMNELGIEGIQRLMQPKNE